MKRPYKQYFKNYHKLKAMFEKLLKQPCDKILARALIEADYYRASYDSIRKWLLCKKGINITMPHLLLGGNCYEVFIRYLIGSTWNEHPIRGQDGTPEGAFRDACLTALELLAEEPPRLNWWQRIFRRLGLLDKTAAELWYEEIVLPLKRANPPAINRKS